MHERREMMSAGRYQGGRLAERYAAQMARSRRLDHQRRRRLRELLAVRRILPVLLMLGLFLTVAVAVWLGAKQLTVRRVAPGTVAVPRSVRCAPLGEGSKAVSGKEFVDGGLLSVVVDWPYK